MFHPASITPAAVDTALSLLVQEGIVFCFGPFYSLHNNAGLAKRRLAGNALAAEQMQIAQKVARLLAAFPYVKGIAVSGSLSKNYADEHSDIDFFIITTANRLWIARTIMHLYKKLTFLTGKQHWFCMNYYIDEAVQDIPEKNIFTAMEIITLVPMQGQKSMNEFIINNSWIKKYFPVHTTGVTPVGEIQPGTIRKITEKIFSGSMGNRVDHWLMNITQQRWLKKTQQGKLNSRGCIMAMSAGKHFSKPDPKNFQAGIIQQYETTLSQLLPHENKTPSPVL